MTPEQMKELAARLRKMAELFRMMLASSTNTAEPVWVDLEAAANLIDSMAQRPTLIPEHVRKIEEAIHAAEYPKGMSVHDGMARINSSLLRRLLAIAELSAQRVPLTEERISDLARVMVKGGKSAEWLCHAIEEAHGIRSEK